jgi:hypothetical protein
MCKRLDKQVEMEKVLGPYYMKEKREGTIKKYASNNEQCRRQFLSF